MEKYFIRTCNASGSLAVEKHLSDFINRNYMNSVVSGLAVEKVVESIRQEQDVFLRTHKAKPVDISLIKSAFGNNYGYLNVGSLCVNLIKVKREIDINTNIEDKED